MKKKVIFINSHPIQYFAPMYKYLNQNGLNTHCWYCSDQSLKGGLDQQFGVEVKWDIPLLDGYEYKFFKNNSWKPSHFEGFFGLINFGAIKELFRTPKSVIVVHGWHYFTLFVFLILGKLGGHTVCLRCDVPLSHEVLKSGIVQIIKRFCLKNILFPRINKFLYIGEQNRLFYKSYGISDERLLSCPYAVDNERFQLEYRDLCKKKLVLKQQLGIPDSSKVILFSGKYIPKKRPLDILQAFHRLDNKDNWLILVGEGELRPEMELFIKTHDLKNVILSGFINQSKISEYYAIGDIFVMCSGLGENWGLSVNEAMNFDLPLVLSNLTGCSDDLVKEGVNGYKFETGNIEELTFKLESILNHKHLNANVSSIDIIEDYSFKSILDNLLTLV